MGHVLVEQLDDIMVLKAIGSLTFQDVVDTINGHYHAVTRNILWNFTHGDVHNISSDQFREILAIVKKSLPNREGGKTAYVSVAESNFGMTRMFSVLAEVSGIAYPYQAFYSFTEAVMWLRDQESDECQEVTRSLNNAYHPDCN